MNFTRFRKAIFPTAHRIILEHLLLRELKRLTGQVLICGAGDDPHGKKMLNAAHITRSDIDGSKPGIDCVADIHDLPFPEGRFDSAVAIETLQHVRDARLAIAEMHRVLRPGGKLLITVPFLFHVHPDPHDFIRFTREGFLSACAQFSSVEALPYGGRIHVISDILTTVSKVAVPLRFINHFLCLGPLKLLRSEDCPSGYIVMATK